MQTSRSQEGFAPKSSLNKEFWFKPRSCTESQLDAQLVRRSHEDADGVAKNHC